MHRFTLLLLALLALRAEAFSLSAFSNGGQPPVVLRRAPAAPLIDGVVEEDLWFSGSPASNFWQYFPSDSMRAEGRVQTKIYMTYDDQYLYIAAICYSLGKNYVIPSLRRDFRAGGSDNITFIFDPFRDRTNAFVFGINPYGVMREALISNGGRASEDFDESWDCKWHGAARIFDNYWSCELAIPFSSLRYKEGETEWYFNCYRFDMQSNTRSTWNHIPQNQTIMSLAYVSSIMWEEPLRKAGSGATLIPYLSGAYQQDFVAASPSEQRVAAGADAKLAVTPGLNLDLTVNPDFSQVEVDRQVLDLSRFELFFPERRQFFLENADLFGAFGNPAANPFFSRRIGLAQDTASGQNINIPILYGARLSGKLDNNWRLGLLNMQTGKDPRSGPGHNYAVATLRRKVFSRSNLGVIAVNKQSFEKRENNGAGAADRFNRVLGGEYILASSDNVWNGKLFYMHSFSEKQGEQPFAHGASIERRVRAYRLSWRHQLVGKDFRAETGYVPRVNYQYISPGGQWYFYPKKGSVVQHGPGLYTDMVFQPGHGKADHDLRIYWDFELRNTVMMGLEAANESTFLFEPFDPSKTGATPLPGEQAYDYTYLQAYFMSDRRKPFFFMFSPALGEYFNGQQVRLRGSLTYRFQPYGFIELNATYSRIDLPEPFASTTLLLVGPRIDFTFSRNVFLTTFLQYNNQRDNFNVNARLQWRFAPVSDFFLVYTDNYDTGSPFAVRNRAIVAKATYWLNI